MKHKLKKIIIVLLTLFLVALIPACGGNTTTDQPGKDPGGEDTPPVVESSYLKGVSEPFFSSTITGFNYLTACDLLEALGSETFRMWMSEAMLYAGYSNIRVYTDEQLEVISPSGKLQVNQYISELKKAGIKEIVGLGSFLPKVDSTIKYNKSNNYVPNIDTDPNSDYAKFLNKVYIIYKTVSATFPDITVWEMGNETNANTFMSKVDGVFTEDELAHINVDYMYYATKGVKEGNPNAITIPAGFAPVDDGMPSIARFYEKIYNNIESGNFPTIGEKSTNKRDYFQGLCWHSYDVSNGISTYQPAAEADFELWKAQNDAIYSVAQKHGDDGLKVWITEFGFTLQGEHLRRTTAEDTSITRYKLANEYYDLVDKYEQYQVDYCNKYFEMMDEMDYLNTIHFFRLFCSEQGMQWNGFGEVYFGLFLEPDDTVGRGFYPRKKAYAIQEIFGGSGDLTKYATL